MAAADFSGADTGLSWNGFERLLRKIAIPYYGNKKVNDDQTMLVKMQKECNRRGAMTQTTSRERTGE